MVIEWDLQQSLMGVMFGWRWFYLAGQRHQIEIRDMISRLIPQWAFSLDYKRMWLIVALLTYQGVFIIITHTQTHTHTEYGALGASECGLSQARPNIKVQEWNFSAVWLTANTANWCFHRWAWWCLQLNFGFHVISLLNPIITAHRM